MQLYKLDMECFLSDSWFYLCFIKFSKANLSSPSILLPTSRRNWWMPVALIHNFLARNLALNKRGLTLDGQSQN